MKRTNRIISIFFSLCFLLATTIIPYSTGAVTSGYIAQIDFESDTSGSAAAGWSSVQMVGESTNTSAPAALGNMVGKFSGADFASACYNTAYSVTSGKEYEVTAWVNHLSYQPGTTETYIGASIGIFKDKNFSGNSSLCATGTQAIYNADGTIAVPTGTSPSGKSYSTLSTVKAGALSLGTWYKMVLKFTATVSTDTAYIIVRTLNGTNVVLYDNITLREVINTPANITLNYKESAIVTTVGTENPMVGEPYQFRITSGDTSPTVTINGQPVTPDSGGVYSITVAEQTVIDIVCDGDQNRPERGKDMDGNDLTKYDQEIYLKPVWEGDTVYHEAALFYTGRESVKLLYPIDQIVSLRSYDLKTYYVEGVDYTIVDGKIVRTSGSRIPIYTKGLTITDGNFNDGTPYKNFPVNPEGTEWLRFIGDTEFPRLAIAVTYKHSSEWEGEYDAKKPSPVLSKLPALMQKLENGEEVNIVIFGDSTACGFSSSGLNTPNSIYDEANTEGSFKTNYVINVAPYAPTWIDMFAAELRVRYPDATINVKNLSLGGKTASWGDVNIVPRLALWNKKPDLVMIGFGGNDLLGGVSAASYKTSTENIINKVRSNVTNGNPNAEIVLLSPKINNPRVQKYSVVNTLAYEQQLTDLSNSYSNIAVAKATSLFANVLESKEPVDYLNTNVNHGNDFFARVYTQMLLAMLTEDPPSSAPGDVSNDGITDLRDVTTLSRYIAGWDGLIINETALDINGDGEVDLKDVSYLSRNLAGWPNYPLERK